MRAAFAALMVLAVTIAGFTGSAAALAAAPGITTDLLLNDDTYEGTPVVTEGDVLTLRVQYDQNLAPGSSVTFEVGDEVAVTGVPEGNSAIESIAQDGNTVTIVFKDPIPVNQGVFDLNLTVNSVERSSLTTIDWKVDGEESSIDVIVKDRDDELAAVQDATAKHVNTGNLNSFVRVTPDGTVSLDDSILDAVLTYTLSVDTEDGSSGLVISDQLPAGLAYVEGAFAAELTTWDEAGLNKTSAPFSFAPEVQGDAFTETVDLPAQSKLRVTYDVRIDGVDGKAELEQLLQQQYDRLQGATGNFTVKLTNTARFGDANREATVNVGGSIAGVGVGSAFVKRANWTHQNVQADEHGNLLEPAPITYTLTADLTKWDGRNDNFTLHRNVVIEDTLSSAAEWRVDEQDFITAAGTSLTRAESCASAAEFAADEFAQQYCVDGQKLLINVGKDTSTNATITVKAQVNTVDGLPRADGQTTVQDAQGYNLRNVAKYHYRDGNAHESGWSSFPVVLPNTDEGYNDPRSFSKSGTVDRATVLPGERVTATYTFALAANKGIDVRESRIVDYLDASVFELSDLSALDIAGKYDGRTLGARGSRPNGRPSATRHASPQTASKPW